MVRLQSSSIIYCEVDNTMRQNKGFFLLSTKVCRTWTLLDSQFVSGRQVKSSIKCP
jgi:hypothetical protein